MKYAIISDIHGNLEALAAVIKDAKEHFVDEFICLGDIVGIGASPVECIEIIKNLNGTTVCGEFDCILAGKETRERISKEEMETLLWTRKQLSEKDIAWLKNLPDQEKIEHFRLVHATLSQISVWQRINTPMDASDHFDFQRESLCFTGHTHIPKIFQLDPISEELKLGKFKPNPQVKCVVTVGSVGKPKDNNPDAAYMIYDSTKNLILPQRVSYDVRSAQTKMNKANFDKKLIHNLALGK
jgi:predicted phosphodiesterase